jgi:hypothetical protein
MRQTLAPSFDEPAHDGAVLSADFGFTEKAKLTGKVTKDYLLDMSGFDSTVLAGWRIVLSGRPQGSQNAVKRSVLTDDDGNFSFDSIAPGTYTARLMRRDSGCGITSADRFKLTIGPGEYRSIEFKVTKTWSVQGTFFGDVNLNGANDPGEGLAGVVVFVDRDSDRKLDEDERFTKTDKHGKHQLSDLMGNETRIACTPPAGWRGKTGFKLDPDSPSNTVNIAFTNTAKVLGFAFLDEKRDGVYGWGDSYDGYGLCTAWVDYDNDDVVDVNEPTAKSADGDFIYGEFSIGHVTPGIRWIKFRCPDGRRMTTVSAYKLDLKPGQTSTRVNFGYK